MTRAEFEQWNLFYINAANQEGLVTTARHRNMNGVVRQYVDEALPFQTSILFTSVGGDTYYFQDSRLIDKTVIRVTGTTFVKTSADIEALPDQAGAWKFIDGSTYEPGQPIVIDFYEP